MIARRLVKLLRLLASPAGRRGLRHGVAMTVEHEAVLAGLAPASVLDVGANKGQFALLARRLYPQAPLVAFEPLPGPAARFRRLFANDPKARMIEAAVGPLEAVLTMHVSAREDSSSLLPIGARQVEVFPTTAETGTRPVRVAPLDRLLPAEAMPAPALLKMDVQGFELDALRGCESRLPAVGWIYVECSYVELYEGQALAAEVEAWLAERGFALSGRFNLLSDPAGNPIQADLLFVRSEPDPII
ncbi:methyltransferase, FkbM family [Tistlia consotensis]|uniref:Methyltransferase, FkbM family n=1 Tax=Tistlia consotensis USBA 355 TaxID=560819 RepID=A0A1Y6CLV1_9PROT|nr:FkbM family methyltransferase [Tistlia consotensis]SMF63232.1 methyltransferase, FkbM family [Tistlia consotensis USBA 355]SNR95907.1 methyltransferase, FkbM family [Tistlia consotensis]